MKLNFIRNKIKEFNVDAFIIINHEYSGQPDTSYVSGFFGSESIIVVTKDLELLIVDGRYATLAKEQAPDFNIRPATRGKVYDDLVKYFAEISIGKILLDGNITYISSLKQFEKKIPTLAVEVGAGVLMQLRQVKTEQEIGKLLISSNIACEAFQLVLKEIQPGMTERSIAGRLEFLMKELGADKNSFDTIVASGVMGAYPHHRASDKEIKTGELVTIDWGCYKNGYASDITRTIAIGEVSDQLRDIYETVRGAQQAGLDAVSSANTGKSLDLVCRNYITQKGYGDYFIHGTGHGLGMGVHELPYVSANNEEFLPVNSVVSIEPGIYIENLGGVRIEDCVVVKKDDHINLSDVVTKELLYLAV